VKVKVNSQLSRSLHFLPLLLLPLACPSHNLLSISAEADQGGAMERLCFKVVEDLEATSSSVGLRSGERAAPDLIKFCSRLRLRLRLRRASPSSENPMANFPRMAVLFYTVTRSPPLAQL
jgi:hypothetical protein